MNVSVAPHPPLIPRVKNSGYFASTKVIGEQTPEKEVGMYQISLGEEGMTHLLTVQRHLS